MIDPKCYVCGQPIEEPDNCVACGCPECGLPGQKAQECCADCDWEAPGAIQSRPCPGGEQRWEELRQMAGLPADIIFLKTVDTGD